MLVKVYTDGAARGNPTDREVMELYWSMWTEKDSCIQKNCRRAIRRQRITGWN